MSIKLRTKVLKYTLMYSAIVAAMKFYCLSILFIYTIYLYLLLTYILDFILMIGIFMDFKGSTHNLLANF